MTYAKTIADIDLSNEFIRTLLCSELARNMSLRSSPLRGACSSENKAYLAIEALNRVTTGVRDEISDLSEIKDLEDVVKLYDAFARRTLDQGDEYVDSEYDDAYSAMTSDKAIVFESVAGRSASKASGDEPDEDEVDEDDEDGLYYSEGEDADTDEVDEEDEMSEDPDEE